MRTPQQRRNLIKLRDEVVKFIPDGELRMSRFFNACGTPACVAGHAQTSRLFTGLGLHLEYFVTGISETYGVDNEEWNHIFCVDLPNDPSWIAANITDLIESET